MLLLALLKHTNGLKLKNYLKDWKFKTARKHLMANMPGDAAFKNGRPKPEDVLPDETTTLTNEAGQDPGLTV